MKSEFSIIKLMVYDFDGVMTDNRAYIDEAGNEMVMVNRSDGLAISMFRERGMLQLILSTERNPVVAKRAEKLGIECMSGVSNKEKRFIQYCMDNSIDTEKAAFVGNDINDIGVMRVAGFSLCPSDSYRAVQEVADYVLNTRGGMGVIREIYDLMVSDMVDNE